MQEETPETEVVQEAPEASEAPETEVPEVEEDAQLGAEDLGDDDGLEDVELNGQQYRVPPEVGEALRRQAEPQVPEIQPEPVVEELAEDEAQLAQMRAEIARFNGVDWGAWYQQDFIAAQTAYTQLNELRESVRDVETRLASRKQEEEQRQRAEWQKRAEKVQQDLKREIKGWGTELARKLTDFARAEGYSEREIILMNANKRDIKLLHAAYLQNQATAKQPQDVKPLRRPVKGKGQPAPRGLSDELPINEWMKRERQLRAESN